MSHEAELRRIRGVLVERVVELSKVRETTLRVPELALYSSIILLLIAR